MSCILSRTEDLKFMKQRTIQSAFAALSATFLMLALAACNPNQPAPNMNQAPAAGTPAGTETGTSSQPGTEATPLPGGQTAESHPIDNPNTEGR
jgi:hypothetical protein